MRYSRQLANLFLSAIVGASATTSVAQTSVEVTRDWQFRVGDDPSWSDPALDDSDWKPIRAGRDWERQGHEDLDGYAWYRKHVVIPETLRDDPAVAISESLQISLGRIDDCDEVWFNGQRIGATGSFPPNYQAQYQVRRVYPIPVSAVRWNEDNVVAVRVYDGDGLGGLVNGRYSISPASIADLVRVQWDLRGGNGLYVNEGPVEFSISIDSAAPVSLKGYFHWELSDDEGTRLGEFRDDAAIVVGSRITSTTQRWRLPEPGVYRVSCTLRLQPHDVEIPFTKLIGYRPELIQAPLTRQPDFDQFWKKTLDELSGIDPQFELKRNESLDSATHEVYEVTMRSLDNVRVRGWYEKPRSGRGYPALIRVPGYGQNMRVTGTSKPLAVFSFNVRGHGNSQDDVPGRPVDYWIRGLDDKDGYYYQGAYADCIRAVDFVASREEIDHERIGITGGSQGGGLSWATAALDERIAACAADIPFLCDWVKYFKASEWPEMDQWIEQQDDRTWESTLKTLGYFDTLNMADQIRCPVLISVGVQDGTCPASTVFSVYNRLAGEKEYRAYPNTGHQVPLEHRAYRDKWIDEQLGVGGE